MSRRHIASEAEYQKALARLQQSLKATGGRRSSLTKQQRRLVRDMRMYELRKAAEKDLPLRLDEAIDRWGARLD